MIGFYNYTVILTYLSLALAMFGIHLSGVGEYKTALICMMMCGACDAFDGMVARSKKDRTEEEKKFGIQIDSLCDLVSFGVFPALFAYNLGLNSIVWVVVEIMFVLAGVIRLAYFNVTEEIRQQQTSAMREFYQGLPITSSSFVFPLSYIFKGVILGLESLYGALLVLAGILFVVNIKIPKAHGKSMMALGAVTLIELIALVII